MIIKKQLPSLLTFVFIFLNLISLITAFSSPSNDDLIETISKKKSVVGVNLYSKWSQTPFYLEASEFLAEEDESFFWKFIGLFNEKLSKLNSSTTNRVLEPKDQYEYTIEQTDKIISPALQPLLKFSLSLRKYSPTIEMFNQIATNYLLSRSFEKVCNVFVEMSHLETETDDRLICDLQTIQDKMNELIELSSTQSKLIHPNIYKIDHVYSRLSSKSIVVILYGDFTLKEFNPIFDYLKQLANKGKISLYLRHFVKKESRDFEKVSLSGYGVELQIKSTEYKAQDDTKVKGEESHLTKKLLQEADRKVKEISGFMIDQLKQRLPDKVENLDKLQTHLTELSKEIATLKIWELQELSLQVTKKILTTLKEEQLVQLKEIIQNFPTYAKSLVKISVEDEIKREIEKNQRYFMQYLNIGTGDTALFINGMFFDLDSVDIFTLVEYLKHEMRLVGGLTSILGSAEKELMNKLIRLDVNDEKTNYLIDIRDSAIIYINDIENDKIYRNWPASIDDLLRPTYPGMLRNVRKNLYHLVLIVDPSKKESFDLIKLAESFYIHKAPLRIGFIFAVNPDLTVNGQNDAGVACLNSFNYIAENKDAYEGLSFLTDLIASKNDQLTDLTVQEVITIFKSKFPKANSDLVFGEDSEYDTGRKLAWEYLNKTAIGKPVQVLLNGVVLKENHLNGDLFEDAVLNEIMKQTPQIQKSVYKGELTDSMDVLDYLMNQKQVIPRLNRKVLSNDESFNLDLSKLLIENDQINIDNYQTKSYSEILAFLNQNLNYISNEDSDCYPVNVWLNARLDKKEGIDLLKSSISYLSSSSKSMRIALIYQANDDKTRLVDSLIRTIKKPTTLTTVLLKALDLNLDYDLVLGGVVPSEYLDELKKNYEDKRAKLFDLHQLVVRNILKTDENMFSITINGKVIRSSYEELFVEDDFSLIEKYSMSVFGEKIFQEVQKKDRYFGKKCSNLIMSLANVLTSNTNSKVRHDVKYFSAKHSVINIPPRDSNSPIIEMIAIYEPLSRGAQKITSILLTLQSVANANIKIFLNCIEKHSDMPLKNFYRYIINEEPNFVDDENKTWPVNTGLFESIPTTPLFTLAMSVPENWLVESVSTPYDLDNIHLDQVEGPGIFADFELEHLLLEGHCFEQSTGNPLRSLQFILTTNSTQLTVGNKEKADRLLIDDRIKKIQDTIVMANLGYFQLKASPGVWNLKLRPGRSEDIYSIVNHENTDISSTNENVVVVMSNFLSNVIKIRVSKKPDKQNEQLLYDNDEEDDSSIWSSLSSWTTNTNSKSSEAKSFNELNEAQKDTERINIFSLASGHLYERLLRIMMLSVLKNTKTPVKFWFLKNYLSPTFKDILPHMAEKYNFDYELVQYKWPRWLHQQTEKQRIIWGYKILFLDVLFPLDVKKIIFVDADQVVRTDLKELRDFDLNGSPYGYTPFCDSREDMDGFRFWKHGYWASHLQGRKYHISALYVVDLVKFRRIAAGDRLRGQYQGLSQDPNSLSNLDQDLPNNMIHQVSIKSLPQEWLWCETWCDDKSKKKAKTIDLCNNPKTKEPKLTAAKRIVPEWQDYDNEIREFIEQLQSNKTTFTTATTDKQIVIDSMLKDSKDDSIPSHEEL